MRIMRIFLILGVLSLVGTSLVFAKGLLRLPEEPIEKPTTYKETKYYKESPKPGVKRYDTEKEKNTSTHKEDKSIDLKYDPKGKSAVKKYNVDENKNTSKYEKPEETGIKYDIEERNRGFVEYDKKRFKYRDKKE